MQLVLLITGVSALSVGAIFFLVYAFINYGIIWRSIIIAVITVAAFTASSILVRRGLRATGEGIAVFAVILVYLDAYAVRANDFFGAASADGSVYWGATMVLAAIGFVLWHSASRLRSPSVIGFITVSPGAGILVAGILDGAALSGTGVAYLSLMTVAVVALTSRLAGRVSTDRAPTGQAAFRLERAVMRVTAWIALTSAVAAGWFLRDDLLAVTASIGVAVAAAAHLLAARTVPLSTAAFGALGAFALATVGVLAAVRTGEIPTVALAPTLVAAAIALGLEAAFRRARTGPLRVGLAAGVLTAVAVTTVALLVPVGGTVIQSLRVLVAAIGAPWELTATSPLTVPDESFGYSLIALTGLAVLVSIAWASQRMLTRRAPALAWLGVFTVTGAVPLLATTALTVGGWFVVAAVFVAFAIVIGTRTGSGSGSGTGSGIGIGGVEVRSRALRAPLVTGAVVATALAWITSVASTSTWAVGYLAAILLVLALRFVVSRGSLTSAVVAPALTAGATLLILAAAGTSALIITSAGAGLPPWNADATRFTQLAATALLVITALPPSRRATRSAAATATTTAATARATPATTTATPISTRSGWHATSVDRRVVFSLALVIALVTAFGAPGATTIGIASPGSTAPVFGAALLPEPMISLVASAFLLLALLIWAITRRSGAVPERIAASIALSPVLYLTVDGFVRVLDLAAVAVTVAPITAALLTAAGGAGAMALRGSTGGSKGGSAGGSNGASTLRLARDIGLALVALVALVRVISAPDDSTWLVLLLGAITALLAAISPDGLFGSRHPRRHLGWVALGLAIASLWWRLLDESTTMIEPFVLPVAGLLLIVAVLVWRAARRDGTGSPVAPILALAGLLTAILPLAIAGVDGDVARPLIVGAVSAVILLTGCLVIPESSRARPSDGGPAPSPTLSLRPYLWAAALAGALGVLLTAGLRSLALVSEFEPGSAAPFSLEAWLGALLAVFLLAAFGLARTQDDGSERLRFIAGQTLVLGAVIVIAVLEVLALQNSPSLVRALLVVLLFAGLHVIAFAVATPPLTAAVAWISFAAAALASLVAVTSGSVDAIELASVPLALGLLASGSIRLSEDDRARSWPWLGPGTGLLLVPSLLATIDDRPLWRLVGLGVVGVMIIVIAVAQKLQAPFLLASVIVVVHAVATFAPQIRAAYEFLPWWLWLVFGGVILIVLAARYEHRVKNVRDVAVRIASLR